MSWIIPPRPKRASRPVIVKSVSTSTRVTSPSSCMVLTIDGLRRALAALVLAARAHHHAPRGLVELLHLELAAVGGRRRAQPHAERAAVGAVLARLGDLGARQAGRHALDVDERLPDPLDRGADLERLLELHSAVRAGHRAARPQRVELGRRVHVLAAAEVVARDVAHLHAEQEVAGALVAGHVAERLEQLAARAAPGGRGRRRRWRGRRRRRSAPAITRRIASGDTRGWSPSVTTTASQSASSASPQASEADWPSSQRAHTIGSAPWRSTLAMTSSAPEPSTTTTRPDRRRASWRAASARAAARRRARRAASARRSAWRRPPRARGRRSSAHLVDPARGLRQAAAVAAVPHRHHLGHDRQRGLLGAHGAEVEADRRRDALEQLLLDARRPAAARGAAPGRAGCPSRPRRRRRSAARS